MECTRHARQEYSALKNKHTDHLIQKQASAYGASLAAKMNHDLKLNPTGPLLYILSKEGGSAAVFAGFDEEHKRVIVEVTVDFKTPGARVVEYAVKLLPGDDTVETEVIDLLQGHSRRFHFT